MEYGSQKTSRFVNLVVVLLSMVPAGATELTYQVRHQRVLRNHDGVLTIGDNGIGYQRTLPAGKRSANEKKALKLESVQFDYQDIQELWVSPDMLRLVTYKDRKWLLGVDKEFEFFLPKGKTFELAYTMLKDKLDRRFVAAVADSQPDAIWELPVKLLGTLQGSEGVLQVARDCVVYKTGRPRQSRTWRLQDIENVSTSGRYQLTLTTYERAKMQYGSMKGFNFQLKRPLDEKRFDALWRRVNQDKGLEFLTAIEERKQTEK
jgi:hypothetical protein